MSHVRIKPHRPFLAVLGVILAAVAAGAAVFLYQQYATRVLRVEFEGASLAHRRLQDDHRVLAENNDALRRQVAVLTRDRQVERIAYDKIDERLRTLQDTVLGLKEEVAFYRGIVASDREQGVHVQTFVVEPDGRERGYRFQVLLTRGAKDDKVTEGSLNFSVTGEHQGTLQRLSFQDLSTPRSSAIAFRFKYFQRLQGHMTLPVGFVPRRVYVQVNTPDERPPSLESHFDWPVLPS